MLWTRGLRELWRGLPAQSLWQRRMRNVPWSCMLWRNLHSRLWYHGRYWGHAKKEAKCQIINCLGTAFNKVSCISRFNFLGRKCWCGSKKLFNDWAQKKSCFHQWLKVKVKYLQGAFWRSRSLKGPDFPCPTEPDLWHYAAELRTLSVIYRVSQNNVDSIL